MRWFPDFSLAIRSRLTALRDRIEAPERALDQLIIDMEEELERVRQRVADAIADEIQLARQVERSRSEAKEWDERARAAMKKGDEALAKAALEEKLAAESRTESLLAEHGEQKCQTARLERSISELEQRIRKARHRKGLLAARLARADANLSIDRALTRAERPCAFAEFSRLEQKVERSEARSAALDRLAGRDHEAEALGEQFRAAELRDRVEKEYAALEERLRGEE